MLAWMEMPADWNDVAGWDAYHQAHPFDADVGSFRFQLPALAMQMRERGIRDIWVPGCGGSPLGAALAHLGFSVVVTDFSAAAVAAQQQQQQGTHFTAFLQHLGPAVAGGSLRAEQHDLRTPFQEAAFDTIFNVKAFSRFSAADLRNVAASHFRALRPGGGATFDTLNVQGDVRDVLEQTLEDVGFVVPFAAYNRMERRALAETGIEHIFILGQPTVPWRGKYADAKVRDPAQKKLRDIAKRFAKWREKDSAKESGRVASPARVAELIYSTG